MGFINPAKELSGGSGETAKESSDAELRGRKTHKNVKESPIPDELWNVLL